MKPAPGKPFMSNGDGSAAVMGDKIAACPQRQGWPVLRLFIRRSGERLVKRGENKRLLHWLAQLPSPFLESEPWLLYWQGMASLTVAPREGRICLVKAYQTFVEANDVAGILLSWAGVVEGYLMEWDDFTPVREWLGKLHDADPAKINFPSRDIELQLASTLAAALTVVAPHHPYCGHWNDKVTNHLRTVEDANLRIKMTNYAITYHIWMANQSQYLLLAKDVEQVAAGEHASPFAVLSWRWTESLFALWGSRFSSKEALKIIDESLQLARDTGIHCWDQMFFAMGVNSALGEDNFKLANHYLHSLEQSMDEGRHHAYALYYYCAAFFNMRKGQLAEAANLAKMALGIAQKTGYVFATLLCYCGLIQIKILQQDFVGARIILADGFLLNEPIRSNEFSYKLGLLQAYLDLRQGREDEGIRILKQTLVLGRDIDMISGMIWWHPNLIAELFHVALDADIERDFVTEIIRASKLQPRLSALQTENWPWPLKIYTMGRLAIIKDNVALEFAGKAQEKPLALLKIIISLGGRQVSKMTVGDYLWPDAEGDKQEQILTVTLHRLRKLLGHKEIITLQGGKMTINPNLVWVDVWGIEQRLNMALDSWQQSEAESVALSHGVLKNYQGSFLAHDDGDWAILIRERLQHKFFRIITRLARHEQEQQQWQSGLDIYIHGLTLFPVSQDLYLGLMQCHLALGNPAEAKAAYFKCVSVLQSQLAEKPSRALQQCYERLQSARSNCP